MCAIMYFVQERRRAEIEEKLEQKRELEKEASMQARKDLFQELKSKKSKIARLAFQMSTIRAVLLSLSLFLILLSPLCFGFIIVFFQYEEWNAHDKQLLGYIKTKATPPIFYLPAEHTPKTEALLKETRSAIEGK